MESHLSPIATILEMAWGSFPAFPTTGSPCALMAQPPPRSGDMRWMDAKINPSTSMLRGAKPVRSLSIQWLEEEE